MSAVAIVSTRESLRVGLSSAEARERLHRDGANELERQSSPSAWSVLHRQFEGPLVWLLIGACLLSLLLQQDDDAAVIGFVLILNAGVGFVQELRAERAMRALRAGGEALVRVARDGRVTNIAPRAVVVGDVLVFERGEQVCADGRLISADHLKVLERDLTGASRAVLKRVPANGAPVTRRAHVYRGGVVVQGSGLAEVIATGVNTQLAKMGSIAPVGERRATLLEQQLAQVTRALVLACVGVVALVAFSEVAAGLPWHQVFLTSVSLAVAAVPEGLPAFVTIALALGARYMAAQRVVVRDLDAIEAVGSTTVLCAGKCGVLTTEQGVPRPGTKAAVAELRRACIRVMLVTGDERESALAVARELGILGAGEREDDAVRAHITPVQKLELVSQLQAQAQVVAMAGEGTNNAPALREADVGFALRESSELVRRAADMVLLDSSLASMLSAVKLGRGIYENIRKTIVYLMAGNVAELTVVFLLSLTGHPLPLLPAQLLWINVVTDSLPALLLVMDPVADEVMHRPPRNRNAKLLGRKQWAEIAAVAAVQSLVCMTVFFWARAHLGVEQARNCLFDAFVFVEICWVLPAKSRRPFWRFSLRENWRLIAVVAGSVALQLSLAASPLARPLYRGAIPGIESLALTLAAALLCTLAIEALKRVSAARPLEFFRNKLA